MARVQLTYRQHLRAVLALGVPLVGSSVASFAVHMTDTIMLGWYDVRALAAAVLATSWWFIIFIVGAGFAQAVMPMVAAAVAEGDEVRARRVTRMAAWLCIGYCVLVLPLMWWADPLFLAMGQTPEIASLSQDYLRIAYFGLFPAMVTYVFRSFVGALHLTAIQFWVTIATVVLNVLANYALIFGNWGAPEMGIRGAAIASIAMQLFSALVLAAYVGWKLPQYHLFQRIWRPDIDAIREVFRLGLPIGLTSLAETALFSASAVMMGWIGELELAAHGIALQLAALMFMFHIGMSQAATIRAGGALGRRDQDELRRGALAAFGISAAFGLFAVAIFVTMPGTLISLFIDPAEPARDTLLAVGITLVYVAALFQMMDAAQVMALSLLRGVQDTTVPMWLAVVSYWLVGMPTSYLLGFVFDWGAVGIWFGLTTGLGAAAVTLNLRFWRQAIRIEA